MPSANEIRQQFIDFFVKKHGHTFVPSSSVVPLDDPTLLFTNAGMNQFKDVFLGTGTRPYKRAADTQKCIRAGGKHNDLDDVGKDTYHHTFFEMLGNWSFGDYFKKEAIRWAWELLTDIWKLDKSRLHATVFEGDPDQGLAPDDEAAALWRSETDLEPSHIHLGNKKDNFWMMGDEGPCGPCTEIHIDRTPDKSGGKLVNAGDARVMEIWNLVFIQFNARIDDEGKRLLDKCVDPEGRKAIVQKHTRFDPLPAKHVDTGMGFERVTAVLQGKASNYDTDVFAPIFAAIQNVTGAPPYTGKLEDLKDTAFRVIADHIRTLTFALTDGAMLGNEGRDYVLRRILRRAERYGRQHLMMGQPFLCELVSVVVEVMGKAFPELRKNSTQVAKLVREEELSFIKTLDRGIIRFMQVSAKQAKENGTNSIAANEAFVLHDTYGFYIDITEQMAGEVGLVVDRVGYEALMAQAKDRSRQSRKKVTIPQITWATQPKATDDTLKFEKWPRSEGATFLCLVELEESRFEDVVEHFAEVPFGKRVGLILDKTNFYAEQGGQVGDAGLILGPRGRFEVEDTERLGDTVLHIGRLREGAISQDESLTLIVDERRLHIMRNHTVTHLMNWALRRVLGDHVEQKGSLVDAEKTRFDFVHDKALTPEEIAEIERLVNERIYADLPVTPIVMHLADAKKIPGVRAVFGEKYPDPVRVLLIGPEKPEDATPDYSVEFCGGTHLSRTGQAGFFKIISQEPVSKGVRRITAVTGREAVATVQRLSATVDSLAAHFNCKPEEVGARVEALQDEVKKLQTQLKKGAASDASSAADKLLADAVDIGGVKVIVGEMPAAPTEQMRTQMDRLRQKAKNCAILVGWVDDGKVGLMAAMTEDVIAKGVEAGKLVGEAAKVVGGKGGGRKDMAQAGGTNPAKLGEALALAKKIVKEKLS